MVNKGVPLARAKQILLSWQVTGLVKVDEGPDEEACGVEKLEFGD